MEKFLTILMEIKGEMGELKGGVKALNEKVAVQNDKVFRNEEDIAKLAKIVTSQHDQHDTWVKQMERLDARKEEITSERRQLGYRVLERALLVGLTLLLVLIFAKNPKVQELIINNPL